MEKIDNFWTSSLESYLAVKDESRKATLYPKIIEIVKELKPTNILDYGCGDGELLFLIKNNCKANISAYDQSTMAINAIRSRLGSEEVNIYENKSQITFNNYDVVICSLVLMTIGTEAGLDEVLETIYKAKKEDGFAIFAITHPCFRQYQYSTFVTQYTNKEPFPYLKEGVTFEVTIFDAKSNNKVRFNDYHWSLSKTVNLLIDKGFSITKLLELKDIPKSGNEYFPPYLIIVVQ